MILSYMDQVQPSISKTVVGILAVLLILGGVVDVLGALWNGVGNWYMGAIGLVNIFAAVGLLKMKRWALYLISFTTFMSLAETIYSFNQVNQQISQMNSLFLTIFVWPILLPTCAVVYFWIHRKAFR